MNTAKSKKRKMLAQVDEMRESLLDEIATEELEYKGTVNLENMNNELAKTPSTERKGVYQNG